MTKSLVPERGVPSGLVGRERDIGLGPGVSGVNYLIDECTHGEGVCESPDRFGLEGRQNGGEINRRKRVEGRKVRFRTTEIE